MPPDQPQGTPDQPGQGTGDEPKFVTVEDMNRAITARFADFQKKIDKSFATSFEGLTTTIVGKVEELVAAKIPAAPAGGDPGGSAAPKGVDIENHPVVKGLQKQLAEHRAQTEKIAAERDAEKARVRDQSLRTMLGEGLTKGGIDPRYVRQAVGILVDVEKRVRFSEDGESVVFREESGDVDLASGLKSWVKSDDAKIYLPPRGTQGAGERPGGRQPGGASALGTQQQPSAGRLILDMAKLAPAAGNNE